jgi:hypothetical protein
MNNITENNKLIAEFMGFKLQQDPTERWFGNYFAIPNDAWSNRLELLHFDTDWNWLMEVVEKIESIKSYDRDVFGTEVKIYKDKCTIKSGHYNTKGVVYSKEQYFDGIRQEKSKKESTYTLCIDFIKWYNKQK